MSFKLFFSTPSRWIAKTFKAMITGGSRTCNYTGPHPRIDDDEFLRRCTPGVNRETALKVRRIISEQLGIEYERIHPEHRFVEDLNAD